MQGMSLAKEGRVVYFLFLLENATRVCQSGHKINVARWTFIELKWSNSARLIK